MAKYLIIRPKFDIPTEWTFYCAQEIIDFLKEKKESFIDLAKEDAVRKRVEETIKKEFPTVVCFYNHGDWDKWVGNDHRPVINLVNCKLLSGKVSYTLACLTAVGLGVEVWKKKGIAYVGYHNLVYLHADKELIDKYYKKPFNAGFYAIYEKKTWKEVKQEMIKTYNKSIVKATRDGMTIVASCLIHNRDALRVYNHDKPCPIVRFFRRIVGTLAYRISRRIGLGILLLGFSIGLYVHDRILQWKSFMARFHGIDVGFILCVIAWLIIGIEYLIVLRRL